jgi:hypothetical protein
VYRPRVILSPEDLALLAQVKAAKKLAPDDSNRALFAGLLARGLVKEGSAGRGAAKHAVYSLAPEGTKALKPPKAQPKPRAQKPAPVTGAELAALEARLLARIDLLARALGVELGASTRGQPVPAPVVATEAFSAAVHGAIRDVDLAGRHGGLVPIPELRKLVALRTGATREQFDLALLSLERDFKVDLKIANYPTRPDAAEGIRVQGRGLVYFALAK